MGREDGFVRREGGAYIVEVCPRTEFSFGYNATTPATFAPLAQAIPSYDWTSGLLIVRVHAVTWVAGTLAVEVRNVSITPDDPSVVFGSGAGSSPPAVLTAATYTLAPTAGTARFDALGAPLGPMLEVGLRATGTTAGTMRITLSIDLIGRTG